VGKNIFSSFGGRPLYLDGGVVDLDVTALTDLLDELVAEPDQDARSELADKVLAMFKAEPAEDELKIGRPISGPAADRLEKRKPIAAAFNGHVPATAFVDYCKQHQ
jgi:hypothetical protein